MTTLTPVNRAFPTLAPIDRARLTAIRDVIRRRMLQTILDAQSGHLGACCSSLELLTALYFGGHLRYDSDNAKHPLRDLVLNRGHLGPLKYSIFSLIGWLRKEELSQYRQYGSRLLGHEDMQTPGVDLSPTGSLGMILSYAAGAGVGFRDAGMPNRIWCFLGDGEEQEGNVSEAARSIAKLGLTNVICVIDANGGQLSTRLPHTDATNLRQMWQAYGWEVLDITDGHNLDKINHWYNFAIDASSWMNKPICIIARTVKGNGVPGATRDYNGFHVYHGTEEGTSRFIDLPSALHTVPAEPKEPIDVRQVLPEYNTPLDATPPKIQLREQPAGSMYDTEEQYLLELKRIYGERLYILTSDYPPRCFVYNGASPLLDSNYYNVGLREQHMTAMMHGLAQVRRDAIVVALCGDAFLYRHMDQLNAMAQAGTRAVFFSVQAGLSGARNGETHQSSGQPGALLMMPGMALEEPATLENFVQASNRAIQRAGPTIVRMHNRKAPWSLQAQMVERGLEVRLLETTRNPHDIFCGTIVTCGMLTVEALQAQEALAQSGRVWNLVNLVSLHNLPERLREYVVEGLPVRGFYNGNPDILDSILHRALYGMRGTPIRVAGFDFGLTGSVSDLLHHFWLDAERIKEQCSR